VGKQDRLLEHARSHLDPGEAVRCSVTGTYEGVLAGEKVLRNGVVLATDRRVVFYAKKLTGYDLESYPYVNISSFELGKDLLGARLNFFAVGNRVSVKWIKDEAALHRLVDIVRERQVQPSMPHQDGSTPLAGSAFAWPPTLAAAAAVPPPPPMAPTMAAGWYSDPTGRHQHRYNNGNAWTEHVADNGLQAIDPL
jgi:hypothetical protein